MLNALAQAGARGKERSGRFRCAMILAQAGHVQGTFSGAVEGIHAIVPGARMVGQALTVWTYPGDWAKPVEAIDVAGEGDVIVIDAGGSGPAMWGELATHSSVQRKLSGVVADGAVRDTPEIREMGFPVWTRLIMPTAAWNLSPASP